MDVSKGLERYLRFHKAEGSSPKTVAWHTLSLGQFARYLADSGHSGDVEDLCADDLRSYIDRLREKGLAQTSVATKVRSVKAWGKWLADEEYVMRDPFARVKQPKDEDKAQEVLTPAEVDKLLATCDRRSVHGARDFALILLMFSTGVRASEALGLSMEDIDADAGLLTVRRGKGAKFRVVPLSRPVEKAIFKYLDHPRRRQHRTSRLFLTGPGAPLTITTLQKALWKRGEQAGIHCHPHKLRRSAATQYLRGGGRLENLKAVLGHTTLQMSLRYARLAGVDLATAHEVADPARALRTRI